jgi:hypothetical protein
MWEQTETVIRWATWAEQEVGNWREDLARPAGPDLGIILRKAAARQP